MKFHLVIKHNIMMNVKTVNNLFLVPLINFHYEDLKSIKLMKIPLKDTTKIKSK